MWRSKLQKIYSNFEEWQKYSEMYGLHKRLGYANPKTAWRANPMVQGSVNPEDYKRVKDTRKGTK